MNNAQEGFQIGATQYVPLEDENKVIGVKIDFDLTGAAEKVATIQTKLLSDFSKAGFYNLSNPAEPTTASTGTDATSFVYIKPVTF